MQYIPSNQKRSIHSGTPIDEHKQYSPHTLCGRRKVSSYGYTLWYEVSEDPEKVTCRTCLKRLEAARARYRLRPSVHAKLVVLAARDIVGEDPEFSPQDFSGGNYDDAYWMGVKDGETSLARTLLREQQENLP